MLIIDSHIHCGVQNVAQPFEQIAPLLSRAGIHGACLFAPVEDIYDRYNRRFDDNENWYRCRNRAHEYLLEIAHQNERIYPYYFVWNDFKADDLELGFRGIKWHHHSGEPVYHYNDPLCDEMIDAICARKLPVVLEETFTQTLTFINRVAGRTAVIIPHLGLLNGGFENLLAAGIWLDANIFADTALAGQYEIETFLARFGADRLIFGSDYPFGWPGSQLQNLLHLGIDNGNLEKILSGNILNLIGVAP